jgi:hypothetical protein
VRVECTGTPVHNNIIVMEQKCGQARAVDVPSVYRCAVSKLSRDEWPGQGERALSVYLTQYQCQMNKQSGIEQPGQG